ncbi:MAG TPA: alpha/beta hydrolase [Bradyrhizobium sp.]|jgi:2-hydroxy-6-oxonona-2,4-dienedioate hydrolase
MSSTELFLLVMSLVVAASVGVVFLLYKNELGRACEAARRGSLVANTDAGPIEYAQKGTGIPLLSIHGAGGGFDQGLANAAEFVDEGFRIIAPSRFGYLRTPVARDASPAAQADAHAALLSNLNISHAMVLGVSAGARSAVELALRHPNRVTALVLISPGTYSPTSAVSVDASRGSKFTLWLVNHGADFAWWVVEKIAPSVLIRFVGVRPELVAASPKVEQDRVANIVRAIEPLSLRLPGINVDSGPDLRELPLARITAPTLIISARDDGFNTLPAAEFAASKIPNAKLLIYDTGGHLLVGHQEPVRTAVRSFLAAVSAAYDLQPMSG